MILPVVRIDNWLIWPGGHSRPLSPWERFGWLFGRRVFPR